MDYYKLLTDYLSRDGRNIEVNSWNTNGHIIDVSYFEEYQRETQIELFDLLVFVYDKLTNPNH